MNKKVLAMLSAGHAITDINQGALPLILAFLQPVFGISQLQVGLAIMAFNLSSSVIQPVFGVFSDRYRAPWLIPAGCLVAGAGMALAGMSSSYHWLLLLSLISGLGVAAYHPEGSKHARYASGEQKASGMALFSVGGNLGFAAGPVLATLFFGLGGRPGFLGFLVLGGLMALIIWVNRRVIAGRGAGAGAASQLQVKPRRGPAGSGLSPVQLAVPVALLVLVVVMRSWTHQGLVTFLPQYYLHYLHQSKALAASITSVFLFAGVLGTLVGGPVADRWGLKNELMGSMALMIPLLYLFLHVRGVWSLVVIALAGMVIISTFAVVVVFAQELLPHRVGLASGLVLGFGIGMGGVGATFLGWVADHWGLPAVFHVLMIFPVVALFLAFFLPGRSEMARRRRVISGEA